VRRRLSDQRGQASIEFAGVLFWLVLTAFVVWELLLVAWAFNQASNAARTASRVDGRGGDAVRAGRAALSPALRDGARIRMAGEKATVRVRIPIVVPGVDVDGFMASGKAELPGT
jgi:Flp pilus assembly protein TadG